MALKEIQSNGIPHRTNSIWFRRLIVISELREEPFLMIEPLVCLLRLYYISLYLMSEFVINERVYRIVFGRALLCRPCSVTTTNTLFQFTLLMMEAIWTILLTSDGVGHKSVDLRKFSENTKVSFSILLIYFMYFILHKQPVRTVIVEKRFVTKQHCGSIFIHMVRACTHASNAERVFLRDQS